MSDANHPADSADEQSTGYSGRVDQACRGWFLFAFVLACVNTLFSSPHRSDSTWPDALLILATTASLAASLARELPLQNVLFIMITIGIAGCLEASLETFPLVPRGTLVFSDRAGPRLFGNISWSIPFVWIITVLVSRAMARLILQPHRGMRGYGFAVMGLTVLLTCLFDFGLQPFATLKDYWQHHDAASHTNWSGVPLIHFTGLFLVSTLTLFLVTPFFINKKPVPSAPQRSPLVPWFALQLLFSASAAMSKLWLAAVVSGISALIVIPAILDSARGKRNASA